MLLAFKELLKESLEGIECEEQVDVPEKYVLISYRFNLSGQINTNMYVNVHMHESESDDF